MLLMWAFLCSKTVWVALFRDLNHHMAIWLAGGCRAKSFPSTLINAVQLDRVEVVWMLVEVMV